MRNKSCCHLLRWHHVSYSFLEALQTMLMPSHRLPVHLPTTLLAHDFVFLLKLSFNPSLHTYTLSINQQFIV